MAASLSTYTVWHLAYGLQDSQPLRYIILKALGKRIDFNSTKIVDNETTYMCIQVDKNSTGKTCKNWTNVEFRPLLINMLSQDEQFTKSLHDLWIKSLVHAFNKTGQ
jgi:hypothetical protein